MVPIMAYQPCFLTPNDVVLFDFLKKNRIACGLIDRMLNAILNTPQKIVNVVV